ncbi:hypothetical protein AALP_AA1G342500 [Arabis alpina]|uniref:Uncharacterized protein n=1 Tax=Arabis alpina TaxID=50452 RepID=A0A087HSI8_ARAAL|nr:hypothetical protein AALP_AA1G342500 [Arabis alpina]
MSSEAFSPALSRRRFPNSNTSTGFTSPISKTSLDLFLNSFSNYHYSNTFTSSITVSPVHFLPTLAR